MYPGERWEITGFPLQPGWITEAFFSLKVTHFRKSRQPSGYIMTPAPTWTVVPFRDLSVDLLRGLAIAVMVAANLVPFLLVPPAPFWLRVIASVAAPLFIFLSGMMVALSFRMKKSYLLLLPPPGRLCRPARGAPRPAGTGGRSRSWISMSCTSSGSPCPSAYLFLKLDLRRAYAGLPVHHRGDTAHAGILRVQRSPAPGTADTSALPVPHFRQVPISSASG